MSYDFRLGAGRTPFYEANYTSNIHRIWAAATDGQGLRNLDGLYGWQVAEAIAKVLPKFRAEPARFSALELDKAWYNSLANFAAFLEGLRNACLKHPRARLRVYA